MLRLTDAKEIELRQSAINQSLEVVRRRIDELGTREASIQRQGADRILVQVPGEKNPENIKRLLGRTARLTFHMVDIERQRRRTRWQGRVPPGSMLLESAERDGGRHVHYVVKRQVELSGENLTDAQPTFQDNQPVVSFRFDNAGARKFGRITQENVGKPFAIVLDDKVISAPNIREPILGGSGIISGSFTVETANELAVLLRAGALPAPLNGDRGALGRRRARRRIRSAPAPSPASCRGGPRDRPDAGLLRHVRRASPTSPWCSTSC